MPLKFTMLDKSSPNKKFSVSTVGLTGGNAHKYATIATTEIPLTRSANRITKEAQSQAGGIANVMYTQPMFFSPLHTPQNWQIASKRREIYQWLRFFYTNEPKVAAGIDFYSQFSVNGFTLECKDRKVLKYYESLIKRLKLNYWCRAISFEYYLLGDVFPFIEYECPRCGGAGYQANGEICNHPDGTIKRIKVLNPDWITVHDSPMSSEAVFTFEPDDELKEIVAQKQPREIYDKLPQSLIIAIANGKPITLSNRCISHIKYHGSPYGIYGIAMGRRLFTYLAYKTKLMTANWIVAERLVLPIRVVKIGSENRPADQNAIQDVSSQLSAVANDPNLTLVTHHAFEYEWIGAAGKIQNITSEIEQVGKEILDGFMLNQAILSAEMGCHDEDTLTLTDSGFKRYDKITKNDKIACYNPKTKILEYHPYIQKHIYDHKGEMIQFKTDKIDILVTPNHRMYVKPRSKKDFNFTEAKDVKRISKLIGCIEDFEGTYKKNVKIGDQEYSIYDFCEMVGFYVSEGFTSKCRGKTKNFVICQSEKGNAYNEVKNLYERCFEKYHFGDKKQFYTYNEDLANYFKNNFGQGCTNKKIPSWVKNLPKECLKVILKSAILGDGTKIFTNDGRKNEHYKYITTSKQLANDIEEIAFKCGYTTSVALRDPKLKKNSKKYFNKKGKEYISRHNQYILTLSEGFKGKYPVLESKKKGLANKEITKINYDGKVYCFTVPHGLFVTKRNDKITIQGNSYSSAQVGIEVMIRRLESWRTELKEWIEDHIFIPEAMMQGFIDEELSKETGKKEYLYPKLVWNKLELRDESPERQGYMQLHERGLISTRTLLKKFDLDYDTELKLKREEEVLATTTGQFLGQPAGGGGMGGMDMMGGGLDLGGGMGGGGMPGMEGGMPGMEGGMPGMDGGMGGGMDGGMGGGMGGGGMPMAAAQQVSPPPNFTVQRKGKGQSWKEAQEAQAQGMVPQTKMIRLTSLEQKMMNLLQAMSSNVPYNVFLQYKVQTPGQPVPYVLDFAYPDIGVGIETDGEIWHAEINSQIKDQQRDKKLANVGWRILRFNESAVNGNMNEVSKIIYSNIVDASNERAKRLKQAEGSDQIIKTAGKIIEGEDPENIVFEKVDFGDIGYMILIGTAE